MKAFLFFCLFISTIYTQAQSHDFVLLKKNNKTVQRLFAGQYIVAAIDSAGPYTCLIKDVFNDSLRLMGYSLQLSGTGYGASYIDTVSRFYFTTHYRHVTALYEKMEAPVILPWVRNKNFNLGGSAFTLKAAGVLGILLTVADKRWLRLFCPGFCRLF